MKVTHQVRTVLLHISLLWESDINVEELSKVAKEDAVYGGGREAMKEVLGAEQFGDGLQVLERHLPDLRFCVPADSLQVRPETVFAYNIAKGIFHLNLVIVG